MEKIIEQWIDDMKKQGISNSHIESMKDRILKSHQEYYLVYDEIEIDRSLRRPTFIDVNKIGGINTGWITANRSVYELFFSITGELPTLQNSLNGKRIRENLINLINHGIEYQHHFYIDSTIESSLRDGLPEFVYFLEDDIYFSNATHRTISAIMFNAPQMVGYVTTYTKNEIKVRNYSLHMQTKKNWNDFLDMELNTLTIKKPDSKYRNPGEFYIYSKEFPEVLLFIIEEPILNATNKNLMETEAFMTEEKRVNGLINKLQEIDFLLTSTKKILVPLPLRLVRKNTFLYSLITELYVKPNTYIDIIKDSSNNIVGKIQRSLKDQIISKYALNRRNKNGKFIRKR